MKIDIKDFPELHWGRSSIVLNDFDILIHITGETPFCHTSVIRFDPFKFISGDSAMGAIIGPEIPRPDTKCLQDKFFGLIRSKYTNPKIMEPGLYWANLPQNNMFRYNFWTGLLRVYGYYPFFKSDYLCLRNHVILSDFNPSDCRIGPQIERIVL